ncbi:helix-turn-helix transcriptional regulator [Phytohabitans flavus]|uniref:Transcriptional regulator n=1 Tax=Phytohabitans flavus TaxID=1076124 RepID=A0A6F8XLD6_9ACTN|nr:helix-turn-helix transcriptional regulator [Phytohabitans flavus]BCB74630.1 transcriptional regulator [Phytohabitans flavus]
MTGLTTTERYRRDQLRDFLRSRRERLRPEDVGITAVGRRRTPGLRRQEVALLAGVGLSWYTWLEQGRDIRVSPEVLDAVASALRLSEPERTHLHLLAGLNPPRPLAPHHPDVTVELRRLLDGWSPHPAMLQDRRWNVLAVNDAARVLFGLDGTDQNCLVAFFADSRYRSVRDHWASVAPRVVAAFRADSARFPDDAGFRHLAEQLCLASPEFAQMWGRHDVVEAVQMTKAVRHAEAGDIVFDATALAVADPAGLRLMVYAPVRARAARRGCGA